MKPEDDPLAILVVPHEVIKWQLKNGLLKKRFFPHIVQTERERGKWVIFHGVTRLGKLFATEAAAHAEIFRIVGEKPKCWKNKRIFKVKQL